MHADNDVQTTDPIPSVRCEPGAAADEIDDQRKPPAPAVADADEREEAGYGYGV